MALEIIWTEVALQDYKKIIDYIITNWSVRIASNFTDTLQSRLKTLSEFPDTGIRSRKYPDVRKIVLSKRSVLYYRADNDILEILCIFDTRQDPRQNKYE